MNRYLLRRRSAQKKSIRTPNFARIHFSKTLACTHTRKNSHFSRTHRHLHALASTHNRAHSHSHSLTQMHPLTFIHFQTCTRHTRTYSHSHRCTNTFAPTHTRTHPYRCTHSHSHTHTLAR